MILKRILGQAVEDRLDLIHQLKTNMEAPPRPYWRREACQAGIGDAGAA